MHHVDMDVSIEIEGYDIVTELAHGSYGAVYLGVQRRLNRLVAIKILDDELNNNKEYVRQFYHEAQVAAQLTHPNIVQAYDFGHGVTDHFYFAMELVDGEDISMKMQSGKIYWRQALRWMVKVAEALDYGMHKRSMTHGDIKPANVMVTRTGEVKLADMGLACMAGEKKNEDQMFTPWYAAPEVIDGSWQIGDPRADMYSFGATLYHMITGRPVFESEDCDEIIEMHLKKESIDSSVFANVPDEVSEFISRLLEKEPSERFATWREIIDEISRLLEKESMKSTHSGSHFTRKMYIKTERRKIALERLKKRKRRKLLIARSYCYAALTLVSSFVTTDFIITESGVEGTVIQSIAENLAGE